MNNLILSITRNVIPYVKELREIAGSVTACILMQQLDYWFSKKPEGYYKFIEPCDHLSYMVGDSWCEELGFSADEYRCAYEKIGIRYKSKSQFLESFDKFQNKFYACYHDRGKNQTFYVRNHDLLDKTLLSLIETKKQNYPLKSNKTNLSKKHPIKENIPFIVNRDSSVTITQQSPFTGNLDSLDTEIDNPNLQKQALPSSLYRTDTTTNITTENSLSPNNRNKENSKEREMIDIWNKVVGEGKKDINLTPERKIILSKIFLENFHQKLSEWQSFCAKIASSKFLMGEVTSFKATIDWALKSENINRIQEGAYGIGDRVLIETSPNKVGSFKDCINLIYGDENSTPRFKQLQEAILEEISAPTYMAWFKNIREGKGRADGLSIQAPNSFTADHINHHFRDILEKIAMKIYGEKMEIKVYASTNLV